ncbi:Inactive cytochrome P450 76AD1 [Bienertia sinuspersici]
MRDDPVVDKDINRQALPDFCFIHRDKPHRAVTELSKFYGHIFLKLGSNTTIVISSLEIAQEMGTLDAMRAANHDKFSMVFLPICPLWRKLRKITMVHLFTIQRFNDSQFLRQRKVNEFVGYVQDCGKSGMPVDIGKAAFTTTLNLLSNTIFSMDLASHTSSNSQEFKDLVWHMMEEGAKPNVSDLFALVNSLDSWICKECCEGLRVRLIK